MSTRGFAALKQRDPEKLQNIASRGGKASGAARRASSYSAEGVTPPKKRKRMEIRAEESYLGLQKTRRRTLEEMKALASMSFRVNESVEEQEEEAIEVEEAVTPPRKREESHVEEPYDKTEFIDTNNSKIFEEAVDVLQSLPTAFLTKKSPQAPKKEESVESTTAESGEGSEGNNHREVPPSE